ncbi:MAG: hypothetical protein QM756_14545 [Polyangiaceae bacterium]
MGGGVGQRRTRAFFHDVAELTGEDQANVAPTFRFDTVFAGGAACAGA